MDKFSYTNLKYHGNNGLLTGGRKGKLVDMKYSRALLEKPLTQ